MRPSCMMAMRSASRIASSKSWVMNTMVFCSTDWSRRNSFCISRRIRGSSAENGSSRNQMSGSVASERAMPTRCCCPPESSCGKLCSRPFSPTSVVISRARASRSFRATPWISSGKATLSSTVRCGRQREVLKHHAHLVTPELDQLVWRRAEQIAAGEHDLAGGRLDKAGEAPHQRRLAGAGKPHDDENLAAGDM